MVDLAQILQDPNYVSANPETKAAIFEKHAPNDPNYSGANLETQAAIRDKFGITTGGAAVGNPLIQKQDATAMRSGNMEALYDITGAAALGAGLGAFGKEILTGAGNVVGAFPYPFARSAGGWLKGAGQLAGAGGRAAPAAAGAIAGAAGESLGQLVEMTGAPQPYAEAARFVGGAIGPETVQMGVKALKWVMSMPTMASPEVKIAKEVGKQLMAKLEGEPQSLTDQERQYLDKLVGELRGAGGKTDQPLEQVGSIMGDEGKRLMNVADQRLIAAQAQAAGMKPTGVQPEMADVGGTLQTTINTRFKGALEARSKEYKVNEERVRKVINFKEGEGRYVSQTPEYQALVNELSAKLESPVTQIPSSQQSGYRKMVDDLRNANPDALYPDLQGTTQTLPGGTSPMSFEALDRIRRKLGEAFRGKPAEGYEAIGSAEAKVLYQRVSDLQKKFAGPGQTKLLDDYAERTEGLQIFSSKYGKKATALDQYREDTFATDPSSLPAAYFKTRASVQTLKELTGSAAQVNTAALTFANKELAGKDAAGVRAWLGKNSEWLAETGPTRGLIDRYATKLEGVERSLKNATDFAAQAAKDTSMLTRQSLPAQRAVDLIKSGDTELWAKITPAIVASPQAKTQMVNAVRQVVADQASSKGTIDLFARNIRPFLEQSKIASKVEMDFIASKLEAIRAMNLPEEQKLGLARRLILQGTMGWAASAAGRGTTAAFGTLGNMSQFVPQ